MRTRKNKTKIGKLRDPGHESFARSCNCEREGGIMRQKKRKRDIHHAPHQWIPDDSSAPFWRPEPNLNFTCRGRASPSGPSGTCFLRAGGCRFPREAFFGGRTTGWERLVCRTGLEGCCSCFAGLGVGSGPRPRTEESKDVVRWSKMPAASPTVAAVASCGWGVSVSVSVSVCACMCMCVNV